MRPRRTLTCLASLGPWMRPDPSHAYTEAPTCGELLQLVAGRWVCPKGHRQRRFEDLPERTRVRVAGAEPLLAAVYQDHRGRPV